MIFSTNNTIFWATISKNSFGGPVFIKQYDSGSACVILNDSYSYLSKYDTIEIRNNIFDSNVLTTKNDKSIVTFSTYGENKAFLFDVSTTRNSLYYSDMTIKKPVDTSLVNNTIHESSNVFIDTKIDQNNSLNDSNSAPVSEKTTQLLSSSGINIVNVIDVGNISIGGDNGYTNKLKIDAAIISQTLSHSSMLIKYFETANPVISIRESNINKSLEYTNNTSKLIDSTVKYISPDQLKPVLSIYQSNIQIIKRFDEIIPVLSIYQSNTRSKLFEVLDSTLSVGDGSYTRNKGTDKSDYSNSGLSISDSSNYLVSHFLTNFSSLYDSIQSKYFIGKSASSSSIYLSNMLTSPVDCTRVSQQLYPSNTIKNVQNFGSLLNTIHNSTITTSGESTKQTHNIIESTVYKYVNNLGGSILLINSNSYVTIEGTTNNKLVFRDGNIVAKEPEKSNFFVSIESSNRTNPQEHRLELKNSLMSSIDGLIKYQTDNTNSSLALITSNRYITSREQMIGDINVGGRNNKQIDQINFNNNINGLTHINYLESTINGNIGLSQSDFTLGVSSKIDSDYITIDNNSIFIDSIFIG